MNSKEVVLSVVGLTVSAKNSGYGDVRLLSDISFELRRGEILGIVGESGAGKTTLARALLQIPRPTAGSVVFCGRDLTKLKGRLLSHYRRQMQLVFQDPFGSLDPMWRVASIVEEPLRGINCRDERIRKQRVAESLALVGLPISEFGHRRPRELSGGQCQRVAIARSLVVDPSLLVLDEAVSALDALIQAQLVGIFRQLSTDLGMAMLYISHNVAQVRHLCDRILVLHGGRICEITPADRFLDHHLHPYSTALIGSARTSLHSTDEVRPRGLRAAPGRELDGNQGCRYIEECTRSTDLCYVRPPKLQPAATDHFVACHYPISAPQPTASMHTSLLDRASRSSEV